jgi:hypothetical protein
MRNDALESVSMSWMPLAAKVTDSGFSTPLKIAVLVVLAPFWWPVLKAIYADLNTAMWREGGLFGKPPAGAELDRLMRSAPRPTQTLLSELRGGPVLKRGRASAAARRGGRQLGATARGARRGR